MGKSLILSTEYIYKYTVIESNVDADLVTKFIYKAQDINLKEIIGDNLYNKLMADCPNFSGYYYTLVKDWIQPCLAEWVVFHALPFTNFKLTNKAVSQKSSEYSQPSTIDDLKWLQSQVRNNAEFLSQRIKDYIKNNQTQFPEYFTKTNTYEVSPNKTNYFSGIYTSNIVKVSRNIPYNNDQYYTGGCQD